MHVYILVWISIYICAFSISNEKGQWYQIGVYCVSVESIYVVRMISSSYCAYTVCVACVHVQIISITF